MNSDFVYHDLRNTLVHARACDEIWWLMEGAHKEREMIKEGCNQYVEFFQTVRPSMFISFAILVSSLFDNRDDCITLKTIPDFQEDQIFSQLWSRGRKLYKYRSKCIAHRDIKNEKNNYAADTGFSYNDIRKILIDSIELYDRTARKQNRVEISEIDISPGKDFLRLMKGLTQTEAQQKK